MLTQIKVIKLPGFSDDIDSIKSSSVEDEESVAAQVKEAREDFYKGVKPDDKKKKRKKIKFPVPPDVRPAKCASKVEKYNTGDMKVSLVIPYLREQYKHIEGTVGSILAYTPEENLEEIIFISDGELVYALQKYFT